MNSVDKSQITIDQGIATWEMTFQSKLNETYMGVFKFKTLLTPMEIMQIDRDYRELIGPTAPTLVDNTVNNLAFCASQLKHRIIKSPPFWDDGNTRYPGTQIKGGEDLLVFVLEAAILAETTYKESLQDKLKESLKKIQKGLDKINKEVDIENEIKELDKLAAETPKTL